MLIRVLVALLILNLAPAVVPASRSISAAQPRSLPEGTLRLGYYYPPDPSSLESLRINAERLEIVAPHWWTIDGDGVIDTDERPQGAAFLRSSNLIVLPSVMV